MKKFLLWAVAAFLFSLSSQAQKDFYATDTIQEIRIVFTQDNWRYLLDSLRYNGEELLLGTADINGAKLEDVGVRYREGRGHTPGAKRNGLFLQLNKVNPDQHYQGYFNVDLSSAIRDPSMVREVLGLEILRKYVPAAKANFARVFINDAFYGLFVNIEPVGPAFLERNFGSASGALFLSDPSMVNDEPDGCMSNVFGSLQKDISLYCYQHYFKAVQGNDWDGLMQMIHVLNREYQKMDSVLDVEKAIWMLAFNNLTVNLSSYTGQFSPNYYLYKDSQGRFAPIVTHLNFGFGSYKNTGNGSDLGIREMMTMPLDLHYNEPTRPLIVRILGNELWRKKYYAAMRQMLEDNFKDDAFTKRAEALQALIQGTLEKDENKYYTMEEFSKSLTAIIGEKSRIPGLADFVSRRVNWVESQQIFRIAPPEISDVSVEKRERFSSKNVTDFKVRARVDRFTKKVVVYYRYSPDQPFMEAQMMDDGKSNDDQAGDSLFGITIKPGGGTDALEYYVMAENAKLVSFMPAHYTTEHRMVTLAELNN
ncbi:MAG: CotH kinase family protein [Lewinellaceae bacterium]|nr:CotH kinase family protein [Lewinella sp.]MCB9281193.1 CotH kinase family protein [Lewinellaceae bacterium]